MDDRQRLFSFRRAAALVVTSIALLATGGVAFAGLPGGAAPVPHPAPPVLSTNTPTPTPTACIASWRVVSSSNQGVGDNNLYGVSAISATDVWAAGVYNDANVDQTLIEHWNGTAWSVVPSPNQGTGDNNLDGVSAVSPTDVWAVGEYFSTGSAAYRTLIEHWNGSAWAIVPSPNEGTSRNDLREVSAISAADVWVVGVYSNGSTSQTLVEHSNGTAWSLISSPNSGTSNNGLRGVSHVSPTDMWAVGDYSDNAGMDRTLVEHYLNACTPTATNTPVSTNTSTRTSTPVPPDGTLTSTPIPTPIVCAVEYPDVPPGSTFYQYVHCLACRGIISGYPNGTFGPGNPVTRGQLSKIVSNAAGYTETFSFNTFYDVPAGSTFFDYVERLYLHGGIQGYTCGNPEPCVPPNNKPYFRPGANVTRGQTSKIVAIAARLPVPPPGQQTFEDVAPGSTFWTWIEALAATGAIQGYPCGGAGRPCNPPGNRPYFRPGANVTRGQSSKIVGNSFSLDCVLRSDRSDR